LQILKESSADIDEIRALNVLAFPSEAEAKLVDRLRELDQATVSLVAESSGRLVGHILFSDVTLPDCRNLKILGLGPMCVAPECQRSGFGTALVKAGLEASQAMGYEAVVVLGHPDYYPKFGFRPSTEFGFKSEYDVPREAFMALELKQHSLSEASGVVEYHPAFANV